MGGARSHGYSARDLKRPAIQGALDALKRGEADALVVAKLDRLSRSLADFAGVMALASKQGWSLVALDCAVDMTTPAGEAMAGVMAVFSQLERKLIGARTREALAEKKAQGVRIGRPPTLPAAVVRRIEREREQRGHTLAAIADGLNAEGVPTAHNGRQWYPSTVSAILSRAS